MTKQNYHHGNLKETLIDKGLELLNQVGYDSFSMRKLATMCGVSHSAPYRHFKNKDELISAIRLKVLRTINKYLKESLKDHPNSKEILEAVKKNLYSKEILMELGKQYVKFFIENPEYLEFLFLSNSLKGITIKNNRVSLNDSSPFKNFTNSYIKYLESISTTENEMILNIIAMLSIIHGMIMLFVKRNIIIEDNYMDYVEKVISKLL